MIFKSFFLTLSCCNLLNTVNPLSNTDIRAIWNHTYSKWQLVPRDQVFPLLAIILLFIKKTFSR